VPAIDLVIGDLPAADKDCTMVRRIHPVAGIAAASLLAAACGFESSRDVVIPTNGPEGPGGLSPEAVGVWTSMAFAPPDPKSCGNFEWKITNQTPTSMAGDFSASCMNGAVEITGSASGHINGTIVPMTASGQAVGAGLTCPFSLTGTGHILDESSMRVDYSGTTCVGPMSGSETLRKKTPEPPPPPPPPSPPPPPDTLNPYHVGDGPLSEARAQQVVNNTAAEFPYNTAPHHDRNLKAALTDELLLRTIWHLHVAGYEAGRQRNPSGAISSDKITILLNGAWMAVDIYTNWDVPGIPLSVIWWPVGGANHVPEGGVPDMR
jgi:hypothetical protein